MSTPFGRTLRALESAQRGRAGFKLAGVLAALAAWAAWMICARVSVYTSSVTARLEVSGMAHQVASSEAGAVGRLALALGSPVRAGDVLLELDSTVEQRKLDEATTTANALEPRLEAARRQVAAERDAGRAQLQLDAVATRRAREDMGAAELDAQHDDELRRISQRLHESALASNIDRINAEHEAAKSKQKASSSRTDVTKSSAAERYDRARACASVAALEAQLVDLEAQKRAALASAETARAGIERRRVRAPIDGRLASIAALRPGDVVKSGDHIATVVPDDDVQVVAELRPEEAAGRVCDRQRARVRLTGFPWTQFGMLDAHVAHVAREPRDGTLRVEFSLDPGQSDALPIAHGLPATVDVEVERVAPWALLLRGAGMITDAPAPPPTGPAVAQGAP